jgi:hypothetical protein
MRSVSSARAGGSKTPKTQNTVEKRRTIFLTSGFIQFPLND